jgi:hypothetical protein
MLKSNFPFKSTVDYEASYNFNCTSNIYILKVYLKRESNYFVIFKFLMASNLYEISLNNGVHDFEICTV